MRPPQPTYANVMSTVAVVLALGTGSAYAAGLANNSVKSRHIATNAVNNRHIADNAVRAPDLATGVVSSRSIGDGAVGVDDLATGSVGSRAIDDSSIGVAEMGESSVSRSEIKTGGVESAEIADETITGIDIKEGAVSSTRMSPGVNRLLFSGGTIAVNRLFSDITVTSSSWPGGAPSSGAQFSATWTQPADTLDVLSGIARVEYPASCSATAGTARGFDMKIVDADNRVISASSPTQADGAYYNGNGFWAQQVDLPGVPFRSLNSTDLANDPQVFVDYVHLPFEMSELVAGGSTSAREVRIFVKRNSTACSPEITGARLLVYRYTLPS